MASITTFNGRRCTKVRRTASSMSTTSSLSMSSSTMSQPSVQAASATPSTSSSSSSSTSSSSSSSSSTSTSTSSKTSTKTTSSSLISTSTSSQVASTTPVAAASTPPPPPPQQPQPPAQPQPQPAAAGAGIPQPVDPNPAPSLTQPAAASQATQQTKSSVAQAPTTSTTAPAAATPTPSSQRPVPAALPSAKPQPPPQQGGAGAAPAAPPPSSQPAPQASKASSAAPPKPTKPAPAGAAPAVAPQGSSFSAAPDLQPASSATVVPPVIPGSTGPAGASSAILPNLSTPISPQSIVSGSPASTVAPGGLSSPADAGVSPSGTHQSPNHDPSPAHQSSGGSNKTVAITAGSISGVVALLLISGLIFFCIKRRIFRNTFVEINSPTVDSEKRTGPRSPIRAPMIRELLSKPAAFVSSFKGQSNQQNAPNHINRGGAYEEQSLKPGFFNALTRSFSQRSASVKERFGRKPSIVNKLRGRFSGRNGSNVGLTENDTEPPVITVAAGQGYSKRRSQSEPRQSMAWLNNERRNSIPKPLATAEANIGRPRSIDSPGQINDYQLPWDANAGNDALKTLRVINPGGNTPTPVAQAPIAMVDDSYFGVQRPAAAAPPTFASHRRSVSLQPPARNPFEDATLGDKPADQIDWLRMDPAESNHYLSQPRVSMPTSSFYSAGTNSRNLTTGDLDRTDMARASVNLTYAIADSRVTSQVYVGNPFADGYSSPRRLSAEESRDLGPPRTPRGVGSNRSSVSSLSSSVNTGPAGSFDSSHAESTANMSPITQESTFMSRSSSDASRGPDSKHQPDARHISYDPFNYQPTAMAPVSTTMAPASNSSTDAGLARSNSTASSVRSGRASLDACSLELGEPGPSRPGTQAFSQLGEPGPSRPATRAFSEFGEPGPTRPGTKAFSTFGEPGPTRPGTKAYSGFTMLNGPMAPPPGMADLPTSKTWRTTRISNGDPFDLDRPELLGYSASIKRKDERFGGLQRSDSAASKRSTTGGRRRSSIQEWRYLDSVEEVSNGSAAGYTR